MMTYSIILISMRVQNIIPSSVRLNLQILRRTFIDKINGTKKKFAKEKDFSLEIKYETKLTQEFKKSTLHSSKFYNIKLASEKIKKVIINPSEIFSFWEIVKQASKNNGFKKGRTISAGKVQESYGGGLCQLSGILYHLCIIAKLEILERHNHSLDIYTEETRFTPLGTDATVAYGYKDLRFKNNFDFPIYFNFELTENNLTAILVTPELIKKRTINFIQEQRNTNIQVSTLDENKNVIAISNYIKEVEE